MPWWLVLIIVLAALWIGIGIGWQRAIARFPDIVARMTREGRQRMIQVVQQVDLEGKP
ncbi:hypothetical protein F9C11_21685 [Amycolatopsis sp. VS8301801F10]|uniref:hypothetical protein n=1 Tax=Amycolatopsis sp. VS8301801F10 TaxID=2652442 RepID=UPI0038FBEBA6